MNDKTRVREIVDLLVSLSKEHTDAELWSMAAHLLHLSNVSISSSVQRLETHRTMVEEVLSISRSMEVAVKKMDRMVEKMLPEETK